MQPPNRRPRRNGFMLLEIVVAIAIILLLAAAITPVVLGGIDAARIDQASKILANLAAGSQLFDDQVGSNAGAPADRSEYPSDLRHLVTPITTAQVNVCNRAYDTGDVGAWNGPYYNASVPATGIKTAMGTISINTVLLTNTSMAFRMPTVTFEDAVALNDLVDGDGSTAAGSPGGTVVFGAADVNGLVSVDYVMPIQSC